VSGTRHSANPVLNNTFNAGRLRGILRKLAAGHAGHDDIGQQEIDRLVPAPALGARNLFSQINDPTANRWA
jgi:hypothetical protein